MAASPTVGRISRIALSSSRRIKVALSIYLFLCSVVCANEIQAATIRVPQDAPTIQGAILASLPGDMVLVSPGTYFENINFFGLSVTLESERGPDVTIIDGQARASVVSFVSQEGLASKIKGFTIRNGRSDFDTPGFGNGGGIQIKNSSPSIIDNIIKDNMGCSGIGISSSFGSPLIQGNTITSNIQFGCGGSGGDGGGIYIGGNSSAQVIENIITNNHMGGGDGGGIALFAAGTPTIKRNLISGNTASGISPSSQGGGIYIVNFSDALIVENLIINNTADEGAGIYWLVPGGFRGPYLVNNTIADNNALQRGSGLFADGSDAQALLINNIIVGRAGQPAVFCGSLNDLNPQYSGPIIFIPLEIHLTGESVLTKQDSPEIFQRTRFLRVLQMKTTTSSLVHQQ